MCVSLAVIAGLMSASVGMASQPVAATASTLPSGGLTGRCAVHTLELPPGTTQGVVSAGDPSGQWLAGVPGPAVHAILRWHNHIVEAFPLPDGYTYAQVSGVTSNGDIVGFLESGSAHRGFALMDGQFTILGPANGTQTAEPVGVADDGTVVGNLRAGSETQPVFWSLDAPMNPQPIQLHPGYSGRLVDVSADGEIAGVEHLPPAGNAISFVTRVGQSQPTTTLRGLLGNTSVTFVAAAADGFALGFADEEDDEPPHLVRWNLRSGSVQHLDDDTFNAIAINSRGMVAGQSMETGGPALLHKGREVLLSDRGGRDGGVTTVSTNGAPAGVLYTPSEEPVWWECGVL